LCVRQVRHPTKEIGSGNHVFSAAECADVRDILIAGQCRFYLVEIAADKETKGYQRLLALPTDMVLKIRDAE
jgi:hypothetical protein